METTKIETTKNTPFVLLSSEDGYVEFSGRSIPEDTSEFFKPILQWVNTYSKEPCKQTKVNFHLEYFNTGSARCILLFLKRLKSAQKNGSSIEINWYYEDDDQDMQETCMAFQSIINIPFNLIKTEF